VALAVVGCACAGPAPLPPAPCDPTPERAARPSAACFRSDEGQRHAGRVASEIGDALAGRHPHAGAAELSVTFGEDATVSALCTDRVQGLETSHCPTDEVIARWERADRELRACLLAELPLALRLAGRSEPIYFVPIAEHDPDLDLAKRALDVCNALADREVMTACMRGNGWKPLE
jgi:hypothetical protein